MCGSHWQKYEAAASSGSHYFHQNDEMRLQWASHGGGEAYGTEMHIENE